MTAMASVLMVNGPGLPCMKLSVDADGAGSPWHDLSGWVLLRRVRCRFDRLDNRGVIILRLVDAGRNGPHAHWLSVERPYQATRVWLLCTPAAVCAACWV